MKTASIILVVLSILLLPISALGNDQEPPVIVPRLFGSFDPQLGVWSEYAIFEKTTGIRSVMRMAIVGQEDGSYWYEVINEEGGSRNIVKMLVTGDPNDSDNIKRLILKTGDQPAQEMPRDFVVMGRRMASHMFESRSGVPAVPTTALKFEKLGKGRVTVPAGDFEITKRRIVDETGKEYGSYKFSPDIRPFGVISSDTETATMVLLAHGSGAESMITEEISSMTKPPGMPGRMPRGLPPGMPPWQDGKPPRIEAY